MGWNGSGDFQRAHNFSADASAGIKILASRQDAEWANYETGLENCVTRDGQNSPSADLPMAGQKHTNVGAAASTTQYLRADQFLRSFPIYCAFAGTAEAMSASAQFALTSLTAGVQVLLSCPSVNTTTSVTLGLTGAGTATVVRADGRGPARGQVKGLHRYIHDGTNWILTDPSPVLGRILVATGSASSNTVAAGVGWATVVSADQLSLSASVVMIPGGIRAVRVVGYSNLQTAASASGYYSFVVQASPDGTNFNAPSWGGTTYPAETHFYFKGDHAVGPTVVADYVSVAENYRVRLILNNAVSPAVAAPTSCAGGYMAVVAID